MDPEEAAEYQQNAIDGAHDEIQDRLTHVNGNYGHGLLDGGFINDHQNDRAEAYLEGYADALEWAGLQVDNIDNVARYVRQTDESDGEGGS